jgi:hypothetical protein
MTTTRSSSDGSPPTAIDLQASSTDTWRLIDGSWLLERTATDEMQYKVNGAVVGHKIRPHPN